MAKGNSADGKDSLLVNKILGAILGTLLIWQVTIHVGGLIYQPQRLEAASYIIEVPDEAGGSETTEAAVPLPVLLAQASADKGANVAKKCASCHKFDKDAGNSTGPNLWGIIGASRAHRADFNYSSAMKTIGGTWDYESLFTYLANPKKFVPGTNMTFVGLPKPADRANLLAYLQQQSDNPVPFPQPEATPAAETPAPAETAAPTETPPPAAGTSEAPAAPAPTPDAAPTEAPAAPPPGK